MCARSLPVKLKITIRFFTKDVVNFCTNLRKFNAILPIGILVYYTKIYKLI